MKGLVKYFDQIRNLGHQEAFDLLEQKRIVFLNEVSMLLALGVILYIPQAFLQGDWRANLLVILLCEILVVIPLILNYQNKTLSARWFFCIADFMFIMLTCMAYGDAFRLDFLFLLYSMIVMIFFMKFWDRLTLLTLGAACQVATIFYHHNYEPFLYDMDFKFIGLGTFMIVLIGVVIIIGRYISTSVKIENNLKQTILDLDTKNDLLIANQQKIRTQNIELENANTELEKFAYVASHDLKSPLRSISSFLKLIQRKVKKQENEVVNQNLQNAISRAGEMHTLIQDIFDYSRIGSDNEVAQVNLNEMVRAIQAEMEDHLLTQNAVIDIESDLPILTVNERQLFLVFQNLIENGLIYNKSEISLISIAAEEKDEKLYLYFKDNGIGIDVKNQAVVFEMFKRLNNDFDHKGSGVGLAVCEKIIQQLGGKISIASELEKGTTIIIQLPQILITKR